MKKKRLKLFILLTIILVISIGFAVLSTSLTINGLFTFPSNTWNVYLDSVVVNQNGTTTNVPTINSDKDTLTFTSSLNKPGDYYSFNVDVVNNSTIDAMLGSITIDGITSTYSDYLACVVTYSNGTTPNTNDILYKTARVTFNVKLYYKEITREQIPSSDLTPTINITINYRQANNNAVLVEDTNHWNFDYTGDEQLFIIPRTGTYKLETWGAQGGSLSQTIYGGYGGYSSGNIELSKTEIVYINIGGMGQTGLEENNIPGGYNGGGSTYYTGQQSEKMTSGGGATHIATESGLLSSLEQNKSSIIIVAGAGGGCYIEKLGESIGGHGGGYIGSTAEANTTRGIESSQSRRLKSTGGTQTNGGTFGYSYNSTMSGNISTLSDGTFGQGGYYDNSIVNFDTHISGGGSGYYGGGAGYLFGTSGGSGYIGNTSLTDKIMYCYECQSSESESDETNIKTRSTVNVSEEPISNYAKKGNGYARITFMG